MGPVENREQVHIVLCIYLGPLIYIYPLFYIPTLNAEKKTKKKRNEIIYTSR